MSENFDGHKDLTRPDVSNADENIIQPQYTLPMDHYSFQPNNYSIFIPSNVFSNTSNTPLTSSINNNHINLGINVENLLPNISFGGYISNLDPSLQHHHPTTTHHQSAPPTYIISQDNTNNNNNSNINANNSSNGGTYQDTTNTIYTNNSSSNFNTSTNFMVNIHSQQQQLQQNFTTPASNNNNNNNSNNGSTTITSEESSFSNPEGWKARSGERDDIPNPRKVVEILRELEKSQQEMNALRESYVSVPNAKRERNRVASRTCRLKKKAVYEINKIKVFHLDAEYKALCNIVKEISSFILTNCSLPSYRNFYTNFYQSTKKKYIPGRMVTGNLEMLIDDVLRNFASGENIDYYSLASSTKKL